MSGETKKPIVINFFNSKNNNFMTKIKSLNSGQSPGIVDYLGPTMPSNVKLDQDLASYNGSGTVRCSDSCSDHPLPNKKINIQNFYEDLCKRWFEKSSFALWNFTINPDPRLVSGSDNKSWGKIKDSVIQRRISDQLIRFFNKKSIRDFIEEVVVYWEYGDKSGKFHCNCTMLMRPTCDAKHRWFIQHFLESTFGSQRAVFFKDGRKFKSPDVYNCKDASFMHNLNFKPLWLTHKLNSINL